MGINSAPPSPSKRNTCCKNARVIHVSHVCMHVCVYINMYMLQKRVCNSCKQCIRTHTCICICMYVHIYIYIYIYSEYMYMHVCTKYVSVYVCLKCEAHPMVDFLCATCVVCICIYMHAWSMCLCMYVKCETYLVVLPERFPVRDCEQSDVELAAMLVHQAFHIDADLYVCMYVCMHM